MSDSNNKQLVVLKEPESSNGKPYQKPKKSALEEDDFTEVNHHKLFE